MALKFKTYERTESSLQELGQLGKLAAKLQFCPGTLDRYKRGQIKRIKVILFDKKGQSTDVNCSLNVTSSLMKPLLADKISKKQALAILAKLEVIQDENDLAWIVGPRTEGGEEESFSIAELSKEEVSYDELADF